MKPLIEDDEQDRHIPQLTMKELMIAIDSLKKGKSADSKGIKAEDLKRADEETTKMKHEIFSLIIKQNSITPSAWKKGVISVIFKEGDGANPENYRPICGLPQLYKLLSTMIRNQLSSINTSVPTKQGSEKTSRQPTTL